MPFKSPKQRRYLHANEPEIARKWEHEEQARLRKDKAPKLKKRRLKV